MQFRSVVLAAFASLAVALPAFAQDYSDADVTRFIQGLNAEKPELEKVQAQVSDLDEKIRKFRECRDIIGELGSGLKAKIAMKAKCGATSDEGMLKDRAKLLVAPEKAGAAAAGMKAGDYARMKELASMYLGGDRSFSATTNKSFGAHAAELSEAMGIALAKANSNGGGGGGGIGSRIGNAIGAHVGRMFTPDMTWAYVGYLWSLMYMSGATMFETAYTPGQWTQWQIKDTSQPDNQLTIERALLSRDADGSEWWRIKTVQQGSEATDTIILESQFKKLDESGMAMQVVRMRGKLPGDTEGKELMVPQHLSMLSMNAMFPFKPTDESIAGATVGTETVRVGGTSYSAKHVKFGTSGGNMEWWLSDRAPGSVVRVQFSNNQKDESWTMEMVGGGTGAKSELGVK